MQEKEILEFIRQNGPTIPSQIGKEFGLSLLFASAMLGDLNSKGLVRISNLKIGGSPFYYINGQEDMLLNFIDRLNPKDRQMLNMLQEKKILRDNEQTPIGRISLRAIKDFAAPLNVTIGNNKEIFWKWYLLNDNDAESLIREMVEREIKEVSPVREKKEEPTKAAKPEKQDSSSENIIETSKELPEKEINEKNVEKESKSEKEETYTKIRNEKKVKSEPQKRTEPEKKEEKKEILPKEQLSFTQKSLESGTNLNTEFSLKHTSSFGKKVVMYIEEKGIMIVYYEIIKKNKEFWLIVEVASAIGKAKYYCKIIEKKRLSEAELALALVEAQSKNLPVMILTNGEINKKAKERMNTLFKDINLINI